MDCSVLACFRQVKNKNSSILTEIPPLGAFFPDLILICTPPIHVLCKSLNRLQSFLKSLVMHMNSHVTFFLTVTMMLLISLAIFRTRAHRWNLFQQRFEFKMRNNLLITSYSFLKI